ncbi:MAG: DUF4870 domain-containing protein [Anaerolineales bacterium]|nr:DUF4870 domain-containing protein [Anaerolineales bacterium]MCS7247404.1 DUF4870 domain-containing protein [Anaerolineales bacterium]MDW8161215.1 DUF4870 domain-containing protein [Anaerolineales bacterium]MDW8448255.1 DUF4870 domain-containing protein [Anaerolineales bacterium]
MSDREEAPFLSVGESNVQQNLSREATSVSESEGDVPQELPPAQVGPSEERTWGTLAHLSVLVNLVTGFGGPIAAFLIYLVYRNRSRFIAYQALQSLIMQLIGWYGAGALIGILWAIVGVLSALIIGVVLLPFALMFTLVLGLLPLGTLVYGCYGAYQVSQGKDFRYWLIGDWVRGTLTGR